MHSPLKMSLLVLSAVLACHGALAKDQSEQSSVTGRGVALLEVDYETGRVTRIRMVKSTENRALDDAAVSAYSSYAFQPRTVRGAIKAPINFTLARRTSVVTSAPTGKRSGVNRQIVSVTSELTATSPVRKATPRPAAPAQLAAR